MTKTNRVFNTGATSLVVDEAGHVLGPGEELEVESTDEIAKGLLKAGDLIKRPEPETTSSRRTNTDAAAPSRRTTNPSEENK